MQLLGLLAIPALIAGFTAWKFPKTVTWKEFLLQMAIQTAVIAGGYFIAKHQSLSDTEHLHGRITAKNHGSSKCCHCRMVCTGYQQVCTGSGEARSCSQQCVGYREECSHFLDYYWSLSSTVGKIPIDSCEPNANRVPQEWLAAYVGEPVTIPHTYTNYLKADKESLLVHEDLQGFKVPDYPKVYSRYHVNPVLGDAPVPGDWQKSFREINADLGAKKQVDVTVLATKNQDPSYAQAVEARWLYGPKNSLNVVMGVQNGEITWARVVTFSRVEALKIHLRDTLQGRHITDDIPGIIRSAVEKDFRRTRMAEYEYLARAASPSTGWTIFLYVLGTALAVGASILMHQNDIFGDEAKARFRNYRNR